jgi:hypothetical protein
MGSALHTLGMFDQRLGRFILNDHGDDWIMDTGIGMEFAQSTQL